jgi:hypothetical protein
VKGSLLHLRSLTLAGLINLKSSAARGLSDVCGRVTEDGGFRTYSDSKMEELTVDSLPLWPSTTLADVVRSFPLLISFKAARVSFDGRVRLFFFIIIIIFFNLFLDMQVDNLTSFLCHFSVIFLLLLLLVPRY